MRKPTEPKLAPGLARLEPLLRWLNGDPLDVPPAEVHHRLRAFVASFDGTEDAGFVAVYAGGERPSRPSFLPSSTPLHASPLRARTSEPDGTAPPGEDEEHALWELHLYLVDILRKGFAPEAGYPEPIGPAVQEFPSLRFGIRGSHRARPPKLSRATLGERRAYTAPGAYTLVVDGLLFDLVAYLVQHVLTARGMTALARCPAPTAGNWDQRCGRFLVVGTRGRPREFCSEACRVRNHAKGVRDSELEEQRRKEERGRRDRARQRREKE